MALDPFVFSVFSHSLLSIPREMTINMMRSSYSPIIKEVRDLSTAVLNRRGDVVCQDDGMPLHLNSIGAAFAGLMARHDMSAVDEDDVFITNDPYTGAQHLPDIYIYTPVLVDGELIGFTGTVGHHSDLGGAAVASIAPEATDIFAEGFRIPQLRLKIASSFATTVFGDLFAANIRVPDKTVPDLDAQLWANRTGARRLAELFDEYGDSVYGEAMDEMLTYTEQRMRDSILQLPDGEYRGWDQVDDDGVSDRPFRVHVNVIIKESNITLDFTGTDDQSPGIINAPYSGTISAALTAVKGILTDNSVPMNAGCERPIDFILPPGSVVNPRPPAPVRARSSTCLRVYSAVMRAFSAAAPERVVASNTDILCSINFAMVEDGRYKIYNEPRTGGFGAGYGHDGCNQCRSSLDNCNGPAVEASELEHDFVRIRRFELVEDTSGAGQWVGSMECQKEYEFLGDFGSLTSFSDRHASPPWGLFGGESGTRVALVLARNGTETRLPSKLKTKVQRGDRLVVKMGGSGGYANPLDRDKSMVQRDLLEGRISVSRAVNTYGMDRSAAVAVQAMRFDAVPEAIDIDEPHRTRRTD